MNFQHVFGIVLGVALLGLSGYLFMRRSLPFSVYGKTTEGKVVSLRLDPSKVRPGPPMGEWYFPTMEYTESNGKKLQHETVDAQSGKEIKVGQTFPVVYDSRHPEYVASGTRLTWMKTSLFTLVLGIILLIVA